MYKKIVAGITALTLTAGVLTLPADEYFPQNKNTLSASAMIGDKGEYQGFEYEINSYSNTATITKYTGSNSFVKIPETINGIKVTKLSGRVFAYTPRKDDEYNYEMNTTLTKVYIPDGIREIGENVFYNCSSLNEVRFPDTLEIIGTDAFANCFKLEKITIPQSVTAIYNDAFAFCHSLESVYLPDSVTYMGSYMFWGCSKLKNVRLPKEIDNIPTGAFMSCESLENVTFPSSVNSISEYAFYKCENLKSINLPDTITYMGSDMFYKCTNLKNVKLPKGIVNIPESTFELCSSLEKITLQSYVKSIGKKAFSQCTNLKSINLPQGLTFINKEAFEYCSSLASIKFPSSLSTIEENAFYDCAALKKIHIPDTVKRIGSHAFGYKICNENKTKEYIKDRDIKISGCPGSKAQNYAKENKISFTTAHTYGKWTVTKKPTCKHTGTKIRKCHCGNVEKATIPINKNNHVYKAVKKVSPTYISRGYTLYKCSECGKTIKKNFTPQLKNVKPSQQKIIKVIKLKNAVKIYYKANPFATGYQIIYASNKDFKKGKTISVPGKKINAKTIKNLKSQKTYYIKVRTYRKIGKKIYYGNWSKTVAVKIN